LETKGVRLVRPEVVARVRMPSPESSVASDDDVVVLESLEEDELVELVLLSLEVPHAARSETSITTDNRTASNLRIFILLLL
jgi:hypothetical protein